MPFVVVIRKNFYIKGIKRMSEALDRLTAEVAESRSATNSILTLVAGLSEQIRDAVDNEDDEALLALADDLDAQQRDIAAAVTENTPVSEDDTPVA